MTGHNLLSLIIFLPVFGAIIIAILPKGEKNILRNFAFFFSLIPFFLSLYLFFNFNSAESGFQFLEKGNWIIGGITYLVGVDGINLLMVLLTTFLTPLTILSAYKSIDNRVKQFLISMLLLETGVLGAFLALDLFLFYIFWEFMLIPMYFIIGVWGGERRIYAAVKFFIYTMVGSLLMLVAIIYMYIKSGTSSFAYTHFLTTVFPFRDQVFLFMAFGLAFAIKVPIFPFHTWLPDAHVQAPTPGSVILAGILLKLGTYGFLRYALPLFPEAAHLFKIPLMGLAVIGIVYGSMVAFAQTDIKKMVAYSSVAHLGFVMLGIFALTTESVQGGILQMVNHGISTGALFILVGMIYERRHTREISEYGGIAKIIPLFSATFMIVTLSSIGLPGTNGFIGEFLILSGASHQAMHQFTLTGNVRMIILTVGAALGIVLGAIYMLTMYRKVFFGKISNKKNNLLKDLSIREFLIVIPLILLIFFIGIFPNFFLSKTRATVKQYVSRYNKPVYARTIDKNSTPKNKEMLKLTILNNQKDN